MNSNINTIRRLDMHVSYGCRNSCVFCSEACRLKRFRGQNLSPTEIARVLRLKRALGFTHISFTGGEPSLLTYLPQMLRLARALGFKTSVTTNGYAFSNACYCARTLPLLDEMVLSVHGEDARTHDGVTGSKGSFDMTCAALKNIDAMAGKRLFLITNTVTVKDNLGQLPGILGRLGELKAVKQFLVSYPAPEGRAVTNYKKIAVGLGAFAKMAPVLVRVAEQNNKKIRFFGVPACALGVCAKYSNDFHWSPRLTVERGLRAGVMGLRETLSQAPVRKRFYSAECLACARVGVCGGFFETSRGR